MQKGIYIFERIIISKNIKGIGIKLSLFDKLHFEQINTTYYQVTGCYRVTACNISLLLGIKQQILKQGI